MDGWDLEFGKKKKKLCMGEREIVMYEAEAKADRE